MCLMLVLTARVPVIDRTLGQDRATTLHAQLGRGMVFGLLAHGVLLLLGVAWYLRGSGQPLYAALVAVLCLVVLGFLFSPAAVQWVTRSRDELS